ncbi:NACHT domain-containing protein [Streptomyces broussonetiae]|uniref:NACHT domain-containing protein n=1 Tax=Streptomyces broussonetiae TaxID=2686304 RepID=A0ABV5EHG0_9ACTN
MVELITSFASWSSLLLLVALFGFAPGFLLRIVLKFYPQDDPRRRELLAELYAVPRLERPFWVAEQFETALAEGLPQQGRRMRHKVARVMSRRVEKTVKGHVRRYMPAPDCPGLDVAQAYVLERLLVKDPANARIAILGAPGTGKTLGSRLFAHRLLEESGADEWRVPVWIEMRRWDPVTVSCDGLIADVMTRRLGLSLKLTRNLIHSGRVFPIFDGFDEIDSDRRLAAVRELNRQWSGRPMLITCRDDEQAGLAMLDDAADIGRTFLPGPSCLPAEWLTEEDT